MLGEEPGSQAERQFFLPVLRMCVLRVCPSPQLGYKWTLLRGLFPALDGACLSTAGRTWSLIYLVVSLYVWEASLRPASSDML